MSPTSNTTLKLLRPLLAMVVLLGLAWPASADEIPVEDLPPAVVEALNTAVPGIVIHEAEVEEEDEATIYEIEGSVSSREVEAKVTETGEILELEIDEDPEEEDPEDEDPEDEDPEDEDPETSPLPGAVADALAALFPALVISEFELEEEGGHSFYEICGLLSGSEVELEVTPDGGLIAFETDDDSNYSLEGDGTPLLADELPASVAATLALLAPGLVIFEVEAYETDGGQLFEIEGASIGSGNLELLVHENGLLIELERDSDRDGIEDLDEMEDGTDPYNRDSDSDNYPDGFENDQASDPNDPNSFPAIFDFSVSSTDTSLTIQLTTFEGSLFQIEQCIDEAIGWCPLGGLISGDGETHTFAIPLDSAHSACLFRAIVMANPSQEPVEGPSHGAGGHTTCSMPETLEGMEIEITDDDDGEKKTLCFKSGTRGERVEREDDDEVEFTPFAYTYKKTGNCKARVTLTFATSDGFETTNITLTFSGNGIGAYVSQEYENGEPEDPESGDFTVSMNGGNE